MCGPGWPTFKRGLRWNLFVSDEVLQKQKVAKEALKKLLARQQKEVRETQELIQNLQFDIEDQIGNATTSEVLSSPIATSLLSGFDYGFLTRSEGCRFGSVNDFDDQLFDGYGPPPNIFSIGSQQFMRNLNAMIGEYRDEEDFVLSKKQKENRKKLEQLTLNTTAIWEREESRGPIIAPLIIKIPYYALCYLLDVVFEGRYVPSRFFLLETVARMPYFSYIAMLQLYETLGFWRRSKDVKRIHFAEEWNEFHHLLIMESLGGDQPYWVRFLAQHSALAYYIGLTVLFAVSPSLSYKFSELLETHATDTYGQLLEENEELLKELPPSLAAVEYYTVGVSDPMFGEYQTTAIAAGTEIRKSGTNMKSLYDVFSAILSDECDHVGTMKACLDPTVPVISPSLEIRFITGLVFTAVLSSVVPTVDVADMSPALADGIGESMPVAEGIIRNILKQALGLLQDSGFDVVDGETVTSLTDQLPFLDSSVTDLAADLAEKIPYLDGVTELIEPAAQVILRVLEAIGLLGLLGL